MTGGPNDDFEVILSFIDELDEEVPKAYIDVQLLILEDTFNPWEFIFEYRRFQYAVIKWNNQTGLTNVGIILFKLQLFLI